MIVQVSLLTKDLEGSIQFYKKYCGLSIFKDEREHGMPIVFLGEKGDDPALLELIRSDEPYHGEGAYIGVRVEDFDAARELLIADGVGASDVISPVPGVKFFLTRDPNGMQVKIVSA